MSRGSSERIPYSILNGEKLWKGKRWKQHTRAPVHVGSVKCLRQSCWERGTYDLPEPDAQGSSRLCSQGPRSDLLLEGALKAEPKAQQSSFIENRNAEPKHSTDLRSISVMKSLEVDFK
jgi:hypothetical protein